MSELAIRGQGLSKLYRLGGREWEGALRNVLGDVLREPWKLLKREKKETFWALKDVDLEVKRGEVLGLIGRNGSGKTTLLKLLSRITKPTKGWAEIYGRVGSLLEVGTGFHGDLSGRDNTYLSGAILGMSKREISRKFDEIVAFAEIEKFIDTQVKHYSSGMYVRLAFAVAAHLEPEILLVDEVLAVGDIAFQKKCLGKMGDVARAGRTVVLVSHQMTQMRRLCNRVVWVHAGSVRQDGAPDGVVNAYEAAMSKNGESPIGAREGAHARGYFTGWEIVSPENGTPHSIDAIGPVTVRFTLKLNEAIKHGIHGIVLYNSDRELLWGWAAYELDLGAGVHDLIYNFPLLPLKPGIYTWNVSFLDRQELIDKGDLTPEFHVHAPSFQHPLDEWTGLLNLPSEFTVRARSVDPVLGCPRE
ncbi:MAG TPA: ABC transporter ATP-binding protein [Candidatus Acidoferrum sp.]